MRVFNLTQCDCNKARVILVRLASRYLMKKDHHPRLGQLGLNLLLEDHFPSFRVQLY